MLGTVSTALKEGIQHVAKYASVIPCSTARHGRSREGTSASRFTATRFRIQLASACAAPKLGRELRLTTPAPNTTTPTNANA